MVTRAVPETWETAAKQLTPNWERKWRWPPVTAYRLHKKVGQFYCWLQRVINISIYMWNSILSYCKGYVTTVCNPVAALTSRERIMTLFVLHPRDSVKNNTIYICPFQTGCHIYFFFAWLLTKQLYPAINTMEVWWIWN